MSTKVRSHTISNYFKKYISQKNNNLVQIKYMIFLLKILLKSLKLIKAQLKVTIQKPKYKFLLQG